MNKFTLNFQCENDAFFDGDDNFDTFEVVRLIRHVADMVEAGTVGGQVRDINGAKVGGWDLEVES